MIIDWINFDNRNSIQLFVYVTLKLLIAEIAINFADIGTKSRRIPKNFGFDKDCNISIKKIYSSRINSGIFSFLNSQEKLKTSSMTMRNLHFEVWCYKPKKMRKKIPENWLKYIKNAILLEKDQVWQVKLLKERLVCYKHSKGKLEQFREIRFFNVNFAHRVIGFFWIKQNMTPRDADAHFNKKEIKNS